MPVTMEQETRALPVKLTEVELRAMGDQLAAEAASLERTEDERRSASTNYRERCKQIKQRMKKLYVAVTSKEEERAVVCSWRKDYKRNVAELRRDDTDEVVNQRALSPEERQLELAPKGKAKGKKKDEKTPAPADKPKKERKPKATNNVTPISAGTGGTAA